MLIGTTSQERGVQRKSGWSKGLTAATDPRVARMARAKIGTSSWAKGLKAQTDPRIARRAAAQRGRKRGPYRSAGHSRSRSVWTGLQPTQRAPYAYLLAMYLGDGWIKRLRRTYALQIYLDTRYPEVIERCAEAIREVRPGAWVGFYPRTGCTAVNSYWRGWPTLLPQHGPGRKHTRPITLTPWQQEIVAENVVAFFRGCIDSDGCRSRRLVNGKNYPFYQFDNQSQDIRGMFESACSALGIHFTRPTRATVAITRRADVARIDELIGTAPKGARRTTESARRVASALADDMQLRRSRAVRR